MLYQVRKQRIDEQTIPALARLSAAGISKKQVAEHIGISGASLSPQGLLDASEKVLERVEEYATVEGVQEVPSEAQTIECLTTLKGRSSYKAIGEKLKVRYQQVSGWHKGRIPIPPMRRTQIIKLFNS